VSISVILAATPLPKTMKRLRKDHRGYPVPFVALVERAGVAHFDVHDPAKVKACVECHLCGVCGTRLPNGAAWFAGGPRSFLSPRGAFTDPPMHGDCCRYAMRVCPYIAAPTYARRIDGRRVPDGIAVTKQDMLERRPPFFVMASCARWYVHPGEEGMTIFRPAARFVGSEVWRRGEKVEEAEAHGLLAAEREAMEGEP
jgi:hypothetical protein